MSRPSLLTPEIRAWIGRTYRPRKGLVTLRDIAKYCAALDDANPRFLDPEQAVAPPLFHGIVTSNLEPLSRLREDGLPSENVVPPLPLSRLMAGGLEAEFLAPIRPGDTLTAVTKVADIRERSGQTGPLIFTVLETTVTNQRDEVVVIERQTLIAR